MSYIIYLASEPGHFALSYRGINPNHNNRDSYKPCNFRKELRRSDEAFSMSNLPEIKDVEQLSPCVTRIVGQNPSGFTLQGTNTYLIGHPKHKERLLLDTGSGIPVYTELLRNYLTKNGLTLGAIAISHWHPDHHGGLPEVLTIAPNARLYKYVVNELRTAPYSFQHWADEQVLVECGVHLKGFYTPGHCEDHLSIWLEEEGVLFSGDNLLGHGSSVFKDFGLYLNSLMRMRDLPNLALVYPGHGLPIKDGVDGFNQNIELRYRRIQDIYEELKMHTELTEEELVRSIYKDFDSRSRIVQIGALSNTQHYLEKLKKDEKVEFNGIKWRARI